jgi:hypothetical protein
VGTIERSQVAADASTATQALEFSVDGAAISARAGQRSPALADPRCA